MFQRLNRRWSHSERGPWRLGRETYRPFQRLNRRWSHSEMIEPYNKNRQYRFNASIGDGLIPSHPALK